MGFVPFIYTKTPLTFDLLIYDLSGDSEFTKRLPNERKKELTGKRRKLYEIIFEADTRAGLIFDVVLLCCIIINVLVVMLERVDTVRTRFGVWLSFAEWFFTITIMFLVEGPEHGFDNIPIRIYFAVVTMTTVGYGDIAP